MHESRVRVRPLTAAARPLSLACAREGSPTPTPAPCLISQPASPPIASPPAKAAALDPNAVVLSTLGGLTAWPSELRLPLRGRDRDGFVAAVAERLKGKTITVRGERREVEGFDLIDKTFNFKGGHRETLRPFASNGAPWELVHSSRF